MATAPVILPSDDETRELNTNIAAQLSQLPTTITSADEYRKAKESLPLLKRAEDRVVLFFKDIKEAANRAHKSITAKENEALSPIKQARQRMSNLIYGYEQEQIRIKREEEQRAAAEEKRRREEEALREAEAMSASSPEVAEQILEQEIATPAPVVVLPSRTLEVSGVTTRENWQFVYVSGSPGQKWKDLTDEQRKRVLSMIPREFLMPDESAIGRVVKAMKSGTKIPGLQAYDAGTVAVRG